MMPDMKGVFVPIVTPFEKNNQKVSYSMLKYNICKLNETAVSGYMPLGSNGEFFMLSEKEALLVLKTVSDEAGKDKIVFAGIGRESELQTIEFGKKAADIGVSSVFVLTPHYFPRLMSQDCLKEYYIHVADKLPIPILLYNAPDYAAGVSLTAETVWELSNHPNIIGIKDTSPTPIKMYLDSNINKNNFSVLSGKFTSFFDSMENGASGGVLSCANYIPEIVCHLFSYLESRDSYAHEYYEQLNSLLKRTTTPYGVGGVKAAMSILGYKGGTVRKPLRYPNKVQLIDLESKLKQELSGLGL